MQLGWGISLFCMPYCTDRVPCTQQREKVCAHRDDELGHAERLGQLRVLPRLPAPLKPRLKLGLLRTHHLLKYGCFKPTEGCFKPPK